MAFGFDETEVWTANRPKPHRATEPPTVPPTTEVPAAHPTGHDRQELNDEPATVAYQALPSPAAPGQTTVFGSYELLEQLGHGGMGVIYKARDLQLERVVALKMVRGGLLAHPEDLARFFREAHAAARLRHPNIVPIHEINQVQKHHYYTMDYIPGGCLAQHMDQFRDERAAVALVEKVARAIGHAHAQGILHRDLKPGNILIDDRNEPLVADFGLAKFLGQNTDMTRSGDVLGTPAYMAPEQAAGQISKIGAATDVWALGVILYELLTGAKPFTADTTEEITFLIRHKDPLRPSLRKPGLNRDLQTIILKCLEKEPSQRYRSADAVADDLARWLNGEPILARPLTWPNRAWRGIQRHRDRTAALVFLAVILTAAGVAYSIKRHDSPASDYPLGAPNGEAALQGIYHEFAPGVRTPILEASGKPRWFDVTRGTSRPQMGWDRGELVVDNTEALSAVVFVPDAPAKSYTLRAEVRHEADDGRAGAHDVGIFVRASERITQEGWENCFLLFTFTEQGNSLQQNGNGPPLGQVQFRVLRNIERGLYRQSPLANYATGSFPPQPGTWRQLEVKVTPTTITAYWMGKEFGSVDCRKLENDLADNVIFKLGPDLAKHLGGLGPNGADAGKAIARANEGAHNVRLTEKFGLYVQSGKATFRNVEVELAPNAN